MRRSITSWLGALALGLATFAWSATPGTVQARGGGHGGGGHGGGHGAGHGGGSAYRGGGYSGGRGYNGGGYYGGRGYYGRGYYGRGYGGYGYGYPFYGLGGFGLGYGLGGYGLGGYGYGGNGYGYGYPGYSSGYYDPSYYDNYYDNPPPYYDNTPPNYGNAPSYNRAPAAQPARVTVNVPPDAELSFNGTRTQQAGSVRQFVTPPLQPGSYQYDISATWMENGQRQTQTRQVTVHPGDDLNVTFTPRMAPAQP